MLQAEKSAASAAPPQNFGLFFISLFTNVFAGGFNRQIKLTHYNSVIPRWPLEGDPASFKAWTMGRRSRIMAVKLVHFLIIQSNLH